MVILADFHALVEPKLAAREIEKVGKHVFVFLKNVSQHNKLARYETKVRAAHDAKAHLQSEERIIWKSQAEMAIVNDREHKEAEG